MLLRENIVPPSSLSFQEITLTLSELSWWKTSNKCQVVHFEFTGWVGVNITFMSWNNFVFTPAQLFENLQYDTRLSHCHVKTAQHYIVSITQFKTHNILGNALWQN